ncbi:hypothetical protein [Streptomyces sp. TRM49041]|uniref:hypothetical protein n=1 Tax=Streptomyces sp. TRM49041 TaxID=2603216 RepID=UPI0011EE2047|nr:hypothetical protein [Streptomyces sp. TRM49041]
MSRPALVTQAWLLQAVITTAQARDRRRRRGGAWQGSGPGLPAGSGRLQRVITRLGRQDIELTAAPAVADRASVARVGPAVS